MFLYATDLIVSFVRRYIYARCINIHAYIYALATIAITLHKWSLLSIQTPLLISVFALGMLCPLRGAGRSVRGLVDFETSRVDVCVCIHGPLIPTSASYYAVPRGRSSKDKDSARSKTHTSPSGSFKSARLHSTLAAWWCVSTYTWLATELTSRGKILDTASVR